MVSKSQAGLLARPAGPWVMWPGAAGPCYSGSRCFMGISVGLALVEGLPAAGWATWVPDRSMWAPSVERGGGGIDKSGRVARPACWSVGYVARGRGAVSSRTVGPVPSAQYPWSGRSSLMPGSGSGGSPFSAGKKWNSLAFTTWARPGVSSAR